MKSIPEQTELSRTEGEKQRGKQQSDCDFKLHIRQPCTVDNDGPEVTLDTRGEENKISVRKHRKLHSYQLEFPFKMQCRPWVKIKKHYGF